jgi:diphosphomevalonate decarboxylase
MNSVSAIAHSNIALIKYWGKANSDRNLPATGSLSLTLDIFYTQTQIRQTEQDRFFLNGSEQTGERFERVSRFLNHVRQISGKNIFCDVMSKNHVPTHAGLASSASGFAALAQACNRFFELGLDTKALSELARLGSGSAARSIFPGFARMHLEGYAEPIQAPKFGMKLLVVNCSPNEKLIDSRQAMKHTSETSPYYSRWVMTHADDLRAALSAIDEEDFSKLGELTEYSTLKMHASLMAAHPGYWYFEPASIAAMNAVRVLRQQGLEGYFTLDAGPHVKVLCLAEHAEAWKQELEQVPGVLGVAVAGPGPGAYCL